MAKADQALSEQQRAVMAEHAASVTDPRELETKVTVCNMRPAYNKEFVRMQLKVHSESEPLAEILEYALAKAGSEQKHGVAPRGPRERKVAELLESMGVKQLPITPEI